MKVVLSIEVERSIFYILSKGGDKELSVSRSKPYSPS